MNSHLSALVARLPELGPILPDIQRASEMLITCYRSGGKVLLCGNGGSAADAEHIVGELMKGYLAPRRLPDDVRRALTAAYGEPGEYLGARLQGGLPAISLVSQTALITAISNDIAADMIFAQQVYGYGRRGDVLVAISTSGNAGNVINALQVARVLRMSTLGFTGRLGGRMRPLCDTAICVPHDRTADIQERHLAIYHALCALIEEAIFPV